MSQPPPDQDRPPEQDPAPDRDQPPSWPAGRKSSIWPSGNEPPAWPPIGQAPSRPSGHQAPSRPPGNQAPSWPSGNQGPSASSGDGPPPWPSGPGQGRSPSWSPGDQAPAWPSSAQPPQVQSPQDPPPQDPPLSSPGYIYGYGRRLPRFRRRFPIRAVILLALVIAFGFAVRGLTSHHKPVAVPPSPPASIALQTGLKAPPGVVGASFSLDDGTGNGYQVTLVKVIDPARGANQVSTPDSGKRFVGLVFRIKGLAGRPQGEDANNDAVLVGANGQDYPADLNRIAGYANFDDGVIHVTPGETVTGAVAFQVPNGVAVSTVQWTALSGFGSMVEWNVPA
jgi:hypothetical protein